MYPHAIMYCEVTTHERALVYQPPKFLVCLYIIVQNDMVLGFGLIRSKNQTKINKSLNKRFKLN